VGFIIYAIAYWSKRRSISKGCRLLKVSGINQEKLILEIKRKQESAAFIKKVGGISLVSIFATHIVVIVLFTRNTLFDLLSTLILFVGTALLVLISNWLGGAGTMVSNARMHRNSEF
jgi:uncharacterized membrane protein